tara:strand:+ start:3577 stop:3717 length:141 start_codon:yes stop_codon:yes gene_type:complete
MDTGFKKGTGCFPCESCGKLTRQRDSNILLCVACEKEAEKENEEVD